MNTLEIYHVRKQELVINHLMNVLSKLSALLLRLDQHRNSLPHPLLLPKPQQDTHCLQSGLPGQSLPRAYHDPFPHEHS